MLCPVSDFFPDATAPTDGMDADEPLQPVWLNPPEDVLPGVVPVELILGRSDRVVVMLTGMRAFATGLGMTLSVRSRVRTRRFDVFSELFDEPHSQDQDDRWGRERLKWGFEFADGRRATSVGPWVPWSGSHDQVPSHPVLFGGGGGGGPKAADRDYWLWPLPPPGRLKVVCQWPMYGVDQTVQEIDGELLAAAADRARPIWLGS